MQGTKNDQRIKQEVSEMMNRTEMMGKNGEQIER